MTAVKVILCAIFGGIFGCILSVVALYPLFLAAAGGRDMNGGIAMGMVTGIAPAGFAVGLLLGAVISFTYFNRSEPAEGAPTRNWPAILGVGLLVLITAYGALLSFLQGPPRVQFADEPIIQFEVLTPVAKGSFVPQADLFSHRDDSGFPVEIEIERKGDAQLITGEFRMREEIAERALRIRLTPDRNLKMTIPLYPGFEMLPGFTEWDGVDYMNNPLTGEVELGYAQDVYTYRYQAVPRDPQ